MGSRKRGYLISVFNRGLRGLFGAELGKAFIYGSGGFGRGSRGRQSVVRYVVLAPFLRHMLEMEGDDCV